MPGKKVIRTLDAYSIHGHVNAGGNEEEYLLDYEPFFRSLINSDFRKTRFSVGVDTVALTDVSKRNNGFAFRVVSGNAVNLPLVYDLTTGTAQEVDPGHDRFVVSGVWVIVDPRNRMLVVERKRPGVPIFQLERFLSLFGRQILGLLGLTISLNPVPSASFAREIYSFTRIREASITLRRPNHSWTAAAENMLGALAESNAAEIQIQLNADRGKSLEKTKGVVKEIVDVAKHPIGPLKNATLKGTTPNFEGERVVSLRNHTVKGTARLDSTQPPFVQLEALESTALQMFEDSRKAYLLLDNDNDLALNEQ